MHSLFFLAAAAAVGTLLWSLYFLLRYARYRRKLKQVLQPLLAERRKNRSSVLLWLGNRYDRSERGKKTAVLLRNAGINIKPSEYIAILVLIFLLVSLFCRSFLNLPFPLDVSLAYMAVSFGSKKFLAMKQQRLVDALNAQLPEVCRLIASAVKAGLNVQQAVELVAREQKDPARMVFTELALQFELGTPLETAFTNVLDMVPSRELKLMAGTIIVQRRAGGNLARVMEEMSQTLEAREQVSQELRGKTAENRFIAVILPFMPVLAGMVLNVTFPGFFRPLFTPLGLILIAVVVAIEAAGFVLIRRITDIRV